MALDLDYCMQFCDIPLIIRYYFPEWEPNHKVKCLWHSEVQPSLSIDPRGFGQCFGCGMKIAHIFDLAAKADTGKGKAGYKTWKKYAVEWYKQFIPTIDEDIVLQYQGHLHGPSGQNAYKYLTGSRRLLTPQTIELYKLGFDPDTDRVTIPIYDMLGNVVNIKKFNWRKGQTGAKAISHEKGHGSTRLFPEILSTMHGEFVLCEGEWDALTLIQHRIPAVTFTNGANSWDPRSELLLQGKKIVVCFDSDDGGAKGLDSVKASVSRMDHQETAPKLYPLSPPSPSGVSGKDITEWAKENPDILEVIKEALKFDIHKKRVKLIKREVSSAYGKVKEAFSKHLHIEDEYLIDVVFGTVVANRSLQDMVWLVLIAPAGGLKTEILRSMEQVSWVLPVSRITGHTLISGYKKTKHSRLEDSSLAFKARGKFVFNKDMTSWTEMAMEGLNNVLSQMRELYDGYLPADWGMGEGIQWRGHFGFIGAITPRIDHVIAMQAKVGERFLYYRTQEGDDRLSAWQSLLNAPRRDAIRKELGEVVREFLEKYFTNPLEPFTLSKKYFDPLIDLANVVSWGRATVPRVGLQGDMAGPPIRERSTRAVSQLGLLAQGIALLNGDTGVSKRTWDIIRRVAFSSMPALRRCILICLGQSPSATVSEISDVLRVEAAKMHVEMSNCWSLNLLNREKLCLFDDRDLSENDVMRETRHAWLYELSDRGKWYLNQMKGDKWLETY